MALRAYIDDSGTHASSPVCVAAGYFGGSHYCKQFDLDWDCAIKRRGLSEFHANRFWSRNPEGIAVSEYKDWGEEDCKFFLAELLEIIRRYRIWPVGSAVVLSDWNSLELEERRHLTGGVYQGGRFKNGGAPSKQYFVPFLFAVHSVAAHCDEGHVVDFVVDQSRTLNGYAFEYFERIKTINAVTGVAETGKEQYSASSPGSRHMLARAAAPRLSFPHVTFRWMACP